MYTQEAPQTQRDCTVCHKYEISHSLEKACNSGMTFKDTQGHYSLLDSQIQISLPIVTTSLSSTIFDSEILPVYQCT